METTIVYWGYIEEHLEHQTEAHRSNGRHHFRLPCCIDDALRRQLPHDQWPEEELWQRIINTIVIIPRFPEAGANLL